MSSAAPGWYPVEGDDRLRWWDGQAWTLNFQEKPALAPATATPVANNGVSPSTGSGFPEDAVWSALGKSLSGAGAGRYWLTTEHLVIDATGHGTGVQQVPIAQVADVQVTQSMTQKARGVSTVKVHVNQGGGPVVFSLDDLPEGRLARALISQMATRARMATPVPAATTPADDHLADDHTADGHTAHSPTAHSPTAATSTAPSTADPMELLRMLGELHKAGLLTAGEFDAKRTQVLGRL
jgi:hypothetical protein